MGALREKMRTRVLPHPNGERLAVHISEWHWKSLDWMSENRGVTAGYIIHLRDHMKHEDEISQAFMEFIDRFMWNVSQRQKQTT